MNEFDTVVLGLLDATGVTVLDGRVPVEVDGKTVNYPVPYAVYYSSLGDDSDPRLAGRNMRRSIFFSLTYVGEDRRQAKWAGQKLRDAIEGVRPVMPGHKTGLIKVEESQRVRRDDDAIRPDGSPLFYGVDNYSVPLNIVRN